MPCLTFIVDVWMPFPVCLQNFGPLGLVPPTLGAVSYSPVDFVVAAGINVRLCLLPPGPGPPLAARRAPATE